MPARARRDIIPQGEISVAHVWSRCVQQAFLCGLDASSGVDYSHRREPIRKLLEYQAGVFAVDVGNYTILHNHKHAILRTRPDVADQWSDEEVAWRWKMAWPQWNDGQWGRTPTDEEVRELLQQRDRIPKLRDNLSNLSWMMARWKEPLAKLFNSESNRKGHFFEQRFGSRLLESESEVISCSLYLDTNQLKAGAAPSLEASDHSAIQDRIRAERTRESQVAFEELRETSDFREHVLEGGDLEKLYADCWLSPISTNTPLATQPKLIIPEPLPPSSDEGEGEKVEANAADPDQARQAAGEQEPHCDEDEERAPASVSEDAVNHMGEPHHERPRGEGRLSVEDRATFEIHRRWSRSARRRASENCILAIPWPAYLTLAEWAAAQLAPPQAEGAPPSNQIERTAASPTATPSTWRAELLEFQAWICGALNKATTAVADAAATCGFARPPTTDPAP